MFYCHMTVECHRCAAQADMKVFVGEVRPLQPEDTKHHNLTLPAGWMWKERYGYFVDSKFRYTNTIPYYDAVSILCPECVEKDPL